MARGKGQNQKTPKFGAEPTGQKEVRLAVEPSGYDHETIVWRFGVVDLEGDWGWQTVAAKAWWKTILPKLRDFETMTWAELLSAAGGRSHGNNHHTVQVAKMTSQAKRRLKDIRQDDLSELFSLRLDGTKRIYGIRDRRALKLLWYDPHHGDNSKAVYPTKNG